MIDIHNHILFGVDDGAKSLEESLKMLKAAKKQGINTVIATPHFYSFDTDIESLKQKVEKSYEILCESINDDLPTVYLGYELHYFNGIYKSELVKELTLNKGKYLLLELDHDDITDNVIRNIEEIRWQLDLKPIIAHVERYNKCKGYKKLLKIFDHENYFAQITADSLFDNKFKKVSINLIKKGLVDFIASDAHDCDARGFMLKEAYDFIANKFNKQIANSFISNTQNLFSR